MNQQIVNFDGRRFLVETVEHQTVTELLDGDRGAEVAGLDAAEAIALAGEIQANRHIPDWPQTDLSRVLAVRFELEAGTTDPMVKAAFAFAVHTLTADRELSEWLDRMQAGGRAA